jgi:hypothetical protein
VTELWAERPGFHSQPGLGFSLHHRVQTGSGVRPAFCAMDTGALPLGWGGQGVRLATRLHLALRLRMCGAVPPLPRTSSWCGAWFARRDNFTFTLKNFFGVRFPAGSRNFPLPTPCPDTLWCPPSLLSNGYQGLFPWGEKGPERESDHSSPSSAEVKNAWNYTYTPPIRLHGVVLS